MDALSRHADAPLVGLLLRASSSLPGGPFLFHDPRPYIRQRPYRLHLATTPRAGYFHIPLEILSMSHCRLCPILRSINVGPSPSSGRRTMRQRSPSLARNYDLRHRRTAYPQITTGSGEYRAWKGKFHSRMDQDRGHAVDNHSKSRDHLRFSKRFKRAT